MKTFSWHSGFSAVLNFHIEIQCISTAQGNLSVLIIFIKMFLPVTLIKSSDHVLLIIRFLVVEM